MTDAKENLRRLMQRAHDISDVYQEALGTIIGLEAHVKTLQEIRDQLERQLVDVRQHRDRLEQQIDSAVVAQEDYARRCSRDAFLDGANWLEHRLRDKPLSAYYTRMAWEEACKRWGEEGRDAN